MLHDEVYPNFQSKVQVLPPSVSLIHTMKLMLWLSAVISLKFLYILEDYIKLEVFSEKWKP
jgi:hypothetical protein